MKKGKYAKTTKLSKVLTMVLALVLVAGISVGGTLAWLTATSDDVTNTFTVGNIEINIDEDGATKNGDNLTKEYKVVPGAIDSKKPIISVKEGSEKCYVYAYVENQLVIGTDVVGTIDIDTANWTAIATSGNKTLYRYKEAYQVVANDDEDSEDFIPLPAIFTTVTYDGVKITESNIATLKDKQIIIKGFAHQSDYTTQDVADNAAKDHFGFTTPTT